MQEFKLTLSKQPLETDFNFPDIFSQSLDNWLIASNGNLSVHIKTLSIMSIQKKTIRA